MTKQMNTKIDKFYKKRYKILGGPGCGKTTEILKMLNIKFTFFINQKIGR